MHSNKALDNPYSEANEADAVASHAEVRIAARLAESLPWLLLPEGMSCQFVERPTMSAIPNVKPWFAGAFAERGVITPIFDLSRWLDAARPAPARGLVLVRDGTKLIGFMSLEQPKVLGVRPAPEAAAANIAVEEAIRPFCGAAYVSETDACIEFHPFDWVHANAARIAIAE
jgi:hypothetical protein